MARVVFVDSGAWIGTFVAGDQHHADAKRAMEAIEREKRWLVTSDYVLDETVTRIRRQGGFEASVKVGDLLLGGGLVQLLEIRKELRDAAWRIYKKYDDQKLSFTDCTSIAVMENLGITEIFSFDDGFRKVGIDTIPQRPIA